MRAGEVKRLSACAAVAAAALAMLLVGDAAAGTLFGLVDTGELYASTDGGVSWSVRATLPVRDEVALMARATSSDLLLATRSGSIYRSLDAGVSWSAVSAIPASDVIALAGHQSTVLLLAATGGVFRSTDGGSSWAGVGSIAASDVVAAAYQGTAWFALTRTGSVYRSSDDGATWTATSAITASNLVGLASWNSGLWAVNGTGDVWRSLDGGVTFTAVSTLSQIGITGLVAGFGELVACLGTGETAAGGGASSWTWRGAIPQLTVCALASDQPTTTGVETGTPRFLRLTGPWPNPARGEVRIGLELAVPASVDLELLDLGGRAVATLAHHEWRAAGSLERAWRPRGLSAGLYLLRARAAGHEVTRRLVWLGGR
jgi:hypothetical protein